MTWIKCTLLTICLCGLWGCAHTPESVNSSLLRPQLPSSLIDTNLAIPPSAFLYQLTPEQKSTFLAWYHAEKQQALRPHLRIEAYLSKLIDGFTYFGDTLTASEALQQRQGNCMSLALVTTALAKLVGVEIEYKLVNSAPVYLKQNGILLVSSHVKTLIYDPTYQRSPNHITIMRPHAVIDYFPEDGDVVGHKINENTFLAMYYRNQAAKHMVNHNQIKAGTFITRALSLAPKDSENLNMAAVILKKSELYEQALAFYDYGMLWGKDNINLLANYSALLEQQGQNQQAKQLQAKLLSLNDSNPYHYVDKGDHALKQQNFKRAKQYYLRAQEKAPYLSEIYHKLAITSVYLSQNKQAQDWLKSAIKYAWSPTQSQLYRLKYQALQQANLKR